MANQSIAEQLKAKLGDVVVAEVVHRGELTITLKKEVILEACKFLKDGLGYNFLSDLCGVDYLGQAPRFMVVYNLYNITTKERLRIKVGVEESDPKVDSVVGVWGTANWHERECWDLMGIDFVGHPDLRRILLPDSWEGHPLRKDYPLQGPDREPYQDRLV